MKYLISESRQKDTREMSHKDNKPRDTTKRSALANVCRKTCIQYQ